jgi:AraC-like DNA-binding protein
MQTDFLTFRNGNTFVIRYLRPFMPLHLIPLRYCFLVWLACSFAMASPTDAATKYTVSVSDVSDQSYRKTYDSALAKYKQGQYQQAISLFSSCSDYYNERDNDSYLNCIYYLVMCHNHLGNYDLALLGAGQLGAEVARETENVKMQAYFSYAEGVAFCGSAKYEEALPKLTAALPDLIRIKDLATANSANFYIGKIQWALNQKNQAVQNFQKLGEHFSASGQIHPEVREGLEYLIDYCRDEDDLKQEQKSITLLIAADRYLVQHYPYLFERTVKRYTTTQLQQRKQEIDRSMLFRTAGYILSVILFVALCYMAYAHFKTRRLLRKVRQTVSSNQRNLIFGLEPIKGLKREAELEIVERLERFENTKQYLEKDMQQATLARLLETNTKYLVEIINKHRGKGTLEYINDLKIEHIIHLLKTDKKYRNYINPALAEEAGFGSALSFTRAFNQRTGVSPTEFINALKIDSLLE